MDVIETPLADLKIIVPQRFGDTRGFFSESWNANRMLDAGLDYHFVQDNHSLSAKEGTLRGLHLQCAPRAQAKLVRCGRGCLFDVAVDVRQGSGTYGQWFGAELSFENGHQLLIPAGFLHGFVTREPDTEIIYKCTDFYSPTHDRAVRYDDPEIAVDWGLMAEPILSEKDAKAMALADLDNPFFYEGDA